MSVNPTAPTDNNHTSSSSKDDSTSSHHLEDQQQLHPNGGDTPNTSLIDKLLHDTKITTTEYDSNPPSRVVETNNADEDPAMIDVETTTTGTNSLKIKHNPPLESIPSTAFRIRQPNEEKSKGSNEPLNNNNDEQSQPFQTTLHFDSGLTLPVSSTSELTKIALASSAKRLTTRESSKGKTLPVLSKLRDGEQPSGERRDGGDDVHQKGIFSALRIARSSSSSGEPPSSADKTTKRKERISKSKGLASKALQSTAVASNNTTNNETTTTTHNGVGSFESNLLQHVRLVFTSARSVVQHTLIDKVNNSDTKCIEVLTLDPCYLQTNSETGVTFLNDAQCLIDSRIGNGEFLSSRTEEEHTGTTDDSSCWPEWLTTPDTDVKDPSIHLLLILLAKIELSIQESHKQHLQTVPGVGRNGSDDLGRSAGSSEPQTNSGPRSPSSAAPKKNSDVECHTMFDPNKDDLLPPKEDGDCGPSIRPDPEIIANENHPSSSLDLIYREKLRSLFTSSHHKSTTSTSTSNPSSSVIVGEHFQNILKTWAHLNSETDFTRSMNGSITKLFGKQNLVEDDGRCELQAEDLVLMPLSFVVSSSASSTTRAAQDDWRSTIQQLAKKWNEIIVVGLGTVPQELLLSASTGSKGDDDVVNNRIIEETKPMDSVVDNIFDDDAAAAILFKIESKGSSSSGKNKKKKKRRRNKKRKSAIAPRATTGDACQSNSTALVEGTVGSEQQNNVLKVVCELHNTVNSVTEGSTEVVVLPQTPLESKTTNSPKQNTDETKSNAIGRSSNNGDVTTLNTDITVSLVNGVNGTCVVGGGRLEDDENENNDAWETVEPKGGRGNTRNKKPSSDTTTLNCQPLATGRKNKTKSKGAFRQRTSQRRKGKDVLKEIPKDNVKDIVHSILESVDEEIDRNLKVANGQRKERSARHNGDRLKRQGGPANLFAKGMSPGRNARAASLRDVVMGHIASNPPFRIPSSQQNKASSDPVSSSTSSSKIKLTQRSISNDGHEESDSNLKTQKSKPMPSADQNTATTVPETLSGISAATASTSNTNEHETQMLRSDTPGIKALSTSKGKSLENTRNSNEGCDNSGISVGGGKRIGVSESKIIKSAAPLLQTVIGPRDVDSAKSSVASSLEATREDDVGYHLLRSCDKLSDDMITFMDRRALALSTKRRERDLLLAALEETLQSIWGCRCGPTMYGSCATKLDLPSSDLDVVISFDKENSNFSRKTTKRQSAESSNDAYVAEMNANVTDEGLDIPSSSSQKTHNVSHNNSYRGHHQFYPPLTKNGMRVIRLAAELENQPWAVQVKAIPTASVPLIKILADPSRLPGTATESHWLLHQHMAAAVAAAEMNSTKGITQKVELSATPTDDQGEFCPPSTSHLVAMAGISSPPHHTAPTPWRGADVMNGLLSLDITFEGSEHGGLGSTEYTNRVVAESCRETGLPPENTPAVQVLVVIKELLAQRRLNEPFSGGLSSYAILLLVVAVIKERRIIKGEMDRVERQRRAVASEASVPEMPPHSDLAKNNKVVWPTPKQQSSLNSDLPKDNGPLKGKKPTGWDQGKAQLPRKSSWAAIAKKSVTPNNSTQRISIPKNDCNNDNPKSSNGSMGVDFCNTVPEGNTPSIIDSKQDCVPPRPTAELIDKPTNLHNSPLFPHGSNDVLEVLCSGEPTAGKLLMHFLLFYGRYFDSQTTCIDVGARHIPDLRDKDSKFNRQSPFLPREAGGVYDPVTEVYTVDPVVVYDPWEKSEPNMNVARSCYAWSNIRCVFEQCFNTLSGVVERGNGTGASDRSGSRNSVVDHSTSPIKASHGGELPTEASVPKTGMEQRQYTDDVSPLLELLLSF